MQDPAPDGDRDCRTIGVRVLDHVAQGLHDDPVGRGDDVGGHGGRQVDVDLHLDAALGLETAHVGPHERGEALGRDLGTAQLQDHPPQRAHAVTHEPVDRGDVRPARVAAQPLEVQVRGGEQLDRVVVEVPRQTIALLLRDGHGTLEELEALPLVASDALDEVTTGERQHVTEPQRGVRALARAVPTEEQHEGDAEQTGQDELARHTTGDSTGQTGLEQPGRQRERHPVDSAQDGERHDPRHGRTEPARQVTTEPFADDDREQHLGDHDRRACDDHVQADAVRRRVGAGQRRDDPGRQRPSGRRNQQHLERTGDQHDQGGQPDQHGIALDDHEQRHREQDTRDEHAGRCDRQVTTQRNGVGRHDDARHHLDHAEVAEEQPTTDGWTQGRDGQRDAGDDGHQPDEDDPGLHDVTTSFAG